jgi:hypothetical protein
VLLPLVSPFSLFFLLDLVIHSWAVGLWWPKRTELIILMIFSTTTHIVWAFNVTTLVCFIPLPRFTLSHCPSAQSREHRADDTLMRPKSLYCLRTLIYYTLSGFLFTTLSLPHSYSPFLFPVPIPHVQILGSKMQFYSPFLLVPWQVVSSWRLWGAMKTQESYWLTLKTNYTCLSPFIPPCLFLPVWFHNFPVLVECDFSNSAWLGSSM